MTEPWATILAVLIVLVVLGVVFYVIREIFRLPGNLARGFDKVARERREQEHAAALAAGFTPEEIAAVDAKQEKVNNSVKGVIFHVALFVGLIFLSILAFVLLGPFALIIVIPKWIIYLKWTAGRLSGSEA